MRHLCCPPAEAKEGDRWTCPKDGEMFPGSTPGCGADWLFTRSPSWTYPEWCRVVAGVGRQ